MAVQFQLLQNIQFIMMYSKQNANYEHNKQNL